jgi:hypothetical protein
MKLNETRIVEEIMSSSDSVRVTVWIVPLTRRGPCARGPGSSNANGKYANTTKEISTAKKVYPLPTNLYILKICRIAIRTPADITASTKTLGISCFIIIYTFYFILFYYFLKN